jgi:hypothetical protein
MWLPTTWAIACSDRAKRALHLSVCMVTNGVASFKAAGAGLNVHGAIIVEKPKSSELEPFRWGNTFISNAKNAIAGTYHRVDFETYRHRYLAEAQYRVNRCFGRRPAHVLLRPHRALLRALAASRRGQLRHQANHLAGSGVTKGCYDTNRWRRHILDLAHRIAQS